MTMKKIFLAASMLLMALPMCGSALNSCYFTIGENDTLRLSPSCYGMMLSIPVHAHFNGRLDTWYARFTYPEGISHSGFTEGADMTVTYTDRNGQEATYTPSLGFETSGGIGVSAQMNVDGYWDYNFDNKYESYGRVKWEAGDYNEMFNVQFIVDPTFSGGAITISSSFFSSNDTRGGRIDSPSTGLKTVTVIVETAIGDVNADGFVTVRDVTALIDLLLNGEDIPAAADVNRDGTVSIADVTTLIDQLLNGE